MLSLDDPTKRIQRVGINGAVPATNSATTASGTTYKVGKDGAVSKFGADGLQQPLQGSVSTVPASAIGALVQKPQLSQLTTTPNGKVGNLSLDQTPYQRINQAVDSGAVSVGKGLELAGGIKQRQADNAYTAALGSNDPNQIINNGLRAGVDPRELSQATGLINQQADRSSPELLLKNQLAQDQLDVTSQDPTKRALALSNVQARTALTPQAIETEKLASTSVDELGNKVSNERLVDKRTGKVLGEPPANAKAFESDLSDLLAAINANPDKADEYRQRFLTAYPGGAQ